MKIKLARLIPGFLIFAIFLLAAGQASACLCPIQGPPEKESVKKAKTDAAAVFTGQVISVDAVKVEGPDANNTFSNGGVVFVLPKYSRWVTLKVTRVWKGDVVSEIKMIAIGTDCDFPFEAGKTYLVYAASTGDTLAATSCSRTALIDAKNTRKEIKVLNKLKEDL